MVWAQRELKLPAMRRGCHLITSLVEKGIKDDLTQFRVGLCHVFIQHTSASLTINEEDAHVGYSRATASIRADLSIIVKNADPDVRTDMETFLNAVVPEGRNAPWVHTDEGPDDMPAHCKSSMFGASISIPITNGRLNLGTWQGIWMCEHRDRASGRRLVVTMQGE